MVVLPPGQSPSPRAFSSHSALSCPGGRNTTCPTHNPLHCRMRYVCLVVGAAERVSLPQGLFGGGVVVSSAKHMSNFQWTLDE